MRNRAIKAALGIGRTSRWSLIVSGLLAAVLLFLALRGVAWHDMFLTIRHARVEYLAFAFVVLTFSYLLRALRWRVLLSAEQALPLSMVFWATLVGYLGNSFLPARAGEIIRSVAISRNSRISTSYVLATAITERVMDVLVLVIISFMALVSLQHLPIWLSTAMRLMGMLGLVGVVSLFMVPRLEGMLKWLLGRLSLPVRVAAQAARFLEQFLLGMRAFQHPIRAVSFAGLAALIWCCDALMALQVAYALNLQLLFPQALLLLAALGLASAAPSTPGYVGIYQFVAVTILSPFGFSQSQSLAYIITFQAVSYVVVLVWGLLGLWRVLARDDLSPQTVTEVF